MNMNNYSLELFGKYKKAIWVNICILVLISAFSVMGPLLLRNIMNTTNTGFNIMAIGGYFAVLVSLYAFKFVYQRYKFYFAEDFKNRETVNLYKKVFHMQYEKINGLEPTYICERVSTTIDTVFNLYATSITGIFVSALTVIITLTVVFQINKWLFLLFFVQLPLQYFGFQKLLNGEGSKLVAYSMQLQQTKAKSNKNIKALLSDVNGIKQYGESGKIIELIRGNIERINAVEKEGNRYAMDVCTILEFVSVMLRNMCYLLIIAMFLAGSVSIGDLVYLNLVNDIYYGSIGDVINIQINLRDLKGSLQFVSEEIEANYEENGAFEVKEIYEVEGNIQKMGYGDKPLIESGTFYFHRGDVVGIVGTSGCGKSTFVKTLNKFLPGNGIRINGVEIEKCDNHSLRDRIMYLPQNTDLLPCSVQDNILIGNNFNEYRWKELLQMDFMKRLLEQGLDKVVLENASNLSGGDRQKVLLGRIFMQNPDVIILDESMNALDEETGENLFEEIKTLYYNKIIIIISHASRYIDKCNKLVVFEGKHIIQKDNT